MGKVTEIATTDALGRTTQTIYDKLGRVVEVILPDATPNDLTDNPRTKAEYDKVGRVVKSLAKPTGGCDSLISESR
jgi:YD repeat-containing protein